ncbi:MAG TPA: putative DNA-binding domain-containing protein [Rhizobacter sp.]|nr:putative DNA-binding domain-containing protein [Rhizobacter sp.]
MKREAERQRALTAALLGQTEALSQIGLAHSGARIERGLEAYRANAAASAERALASAFPTVQALMGEESFATLAQAFWHAQPPVRGDLACFGESLPAFIADSEQLADVPYLADSARLDWLLAQAERAADETPELATLNLLAELDAPLLHLALMPGVALLSSPHPVVSVWLAHQPGDEAEAHRTAAREALAAGTGEHALVWRFGWRARAMAVPAETARWTFGLLRGDNLAVALEHAGSGFEFEPWLVQALQHGWVARAARAA